MEAALSSDAAPAPSPALTALRRGVTPGAIDTLFAEHRVPLVEGRLSTFLWRGEADAVAIEHRVMGWNIPLPLRRLQGSDLWFATVSPPYGARIEYRLLVRRGEQLENVLDPHNPRVARGPAGEMSVLEADGYVTPQWAEHDPEAPPGRMTEVRLPSRALRRQAAVTLYLPARFEESVAYPVLIVHDGGDFLTYAAFGTVLDNLMHQGLIADAVVAFTQPRDRMREYTASSQHTRFLIRELLPELQRTLPLRDDPASRVLAGASLGAVASLAAAVRAPGLFGGLLLESGSFRSSITAASEISAALRPVTQFVKSVQQAPAHVTQRIFQTYGAYEPLATPNRQMAPTLRAMSDDLRVVEAYDGHNWTNWRDRLLEALAWLLPPPNAVQRETPAWT